MNKNLDHLPASKQDNLFYIVTVLRDEFEQVTGFATGKKKHGRILKIYLVVMPQESGYMTRLTVTLAIMTF